MKTYETSTENISPGLFGEIMGPLAAAVQVCRPVDLQYWVGRKGKLVEKVVALLTRSYDVSVKFSKEIQSWLDLYREEFGIELDLTALTLPPEVPNTWLVIADERVTNNQVFEACAKRFSCGRYTDNLDAIRDLHAKGTTARRFRATVEADPERKNKSADDIEDAGLTPKAMTLKERMLLELWYFRETQEHLDIDNWTICAGSRDPNGSVPSVNWSVDRMSVIQGYQGSRHARDRARIAVS